MSKRGNDHINFTPTSSRAKHSRLLNNPICQTVEEVQQTIAALAEKYPNEDLIKNLQSGFGKLGTILQTITSVESAEEKERKRSMVVIGVPEPENGDSIERADKDSDSVVNMLRALNIQARPSQVYRMGRPKPANDNGKPNPRLIKVVMSSSFFQKQTLHALKTRRQQLKNVCGFARALVRPSLSPDELIEDRKLRERLKKLRAENPGQRLYIKNKEIFSDKSKLVEENFAKDF
jgi:hypothetical protein